ncbi:cytochrome P450 [Flagelloscypha sp. PMI_526]|nr:cytochrome P450 [Flagelloscypha sp. PMI_526]
MPAARTLNDVPSILETLEPWISKFNAALLVCSFGGAFLIYKTIIYPRYVNPLRHIPGPKGSWTSGQVFVLEAGEPGIPFREWIKEYGPIVRFTGFFGAERVVLTRPEALQKILTSDWMDYPRPMFLRNVLGTVAGYGLLTVTGDVHRRMRKAMNPAFSLTSLGAQMDTFHDVTDTLVKIMGTMVDIAPSSTGAVFPVYGLVSKATLDMICLASFGYRTDSLNNPDNELANAYDNLMALQDGRTLLLSMIIFSIPGFSAYVNSEFGYKTKDIFFGWSSDGERLVKLVDTMHRIRAVSRQILKEKLAEASQFGLSEVQEKRDIMSILIREREAEKAQLGGGNITMNNQAMMDQVLTFLTAGHDTTASSITWTLWLLANDQDTQQRLREEVTAVFEANPRPEYRELKDLPWLDSVVMESVRLMPAAPVSTRYVTKTGVIDGHVIPAGTHILIPIRAINTNKDVWGPDAEEFHPSRWFNLPPEVQKNMNMNFLSFLAGPHSCIGKTMSLMETKAAIAKLVMIFVFEPTHSGQVAHPIGAVTMKPADGMPLRVRRVEPAKSI